MDPQIGAELSPAHPPSGAQPVEQNIIADVNYPQPSVRDLPQPAELAEPPPQAVDIISAESAPRDAPSVGGGDVTKSSELTTTQRERADEVQTVDIPSDDDVEKYSFYRNLIDIVHDSISKGLDSSKEPPCGPLNFFCKAVDCKGMCKRRDGEEWGLEEVNDLSKALSNGRSLGWLLHRNMIFPLASTAGRTVWVTAEFIAVFITLGLSIARFSCGNNYIFNIIHLALSIFASVLVCIDVLVVFHGFFVRSIQAIYRKTAQVFHPEKDITKNKSPTKIVCCKEFVTNMFDVGRMVLSELIFYPLLICAMFDMIIFESYSFDTEANQISFVLFIVSTISMLAFVYITRIVISISAMCKLRKKRCLEDCSTSSCLCSFLLSLPFRKFKSTIYEAIHFQKYFVLHLIGQAVSQMVMMAAIGTLIRSENMHFFEDCLTDESIHVSGYLWYMIVAGYILPALGFISFFFTTYYWLQEFLIGISIDFISILHMPSIVEKLGIQTEERREKINEIIRYFNFDELKSSFDDQLHKKSCFWKCFYPFQSPLAALYTFLYAIFHAGFFVSAFISLIGTFVMASDEEREEMIVIFFSWLIFLTAAAVVVYIMNTFSFTVGVFWPTVITIIILLLLLLLLLCFTTQTTRSE